MTCGGSSGGRASSDRSRLLRRVRVGEGERAGRRDQANQYREQRVGDLLAVEERRHQVAAPGAGGQRGGDQHGDQRADHGGADARAEFLRGVVECRADGRAVARHRVDEGDGADRHDGAQSDGHHDHAGRDKKVGDADVVLLPRRLARTCSLGRNSNRVARSHI